MFVCFGEGVINGFLIVRIGIVVIVVCCLVLFVVIGGLWILEFMSELVLMSDF